MITTQITITLEEAKMWYNSDNPVLKSLALKAFDIKVENLSNSLNKIITDLELESTRITLTKDIKAKKQVLWMMEF